MGTLYGHIKYISHVFVLLTLKLLLDMIMLNRYILNYWHCTFYMHLYLCAGWMGYLSPQACPSCCEVDLSNHWDGIRRDEGTGIPCCQEETEVLIVINNLVSYLDHISRTCTCANVSLNKVPCFTSTFNFILPSVLLLFSLYFLPLLSSRCPQCRTVNFFVLALFSFLFNTTFKWITCPFTYCLCPRSFQFCFK